jgi:hypothetical protein
MSTAAHQGRQNENQRNAPQDVFLLAQHGRESFLIDVGSNGRVRSCQPWGQEESGGSTPRRNSRTFNIVISRSLR